MSKTYKNILILSPFFYPEPISTGKFNTDLAIALKDKGHKVTVLCFHPFYPKWKVEKSSKSIKGVSIIRGGKYNYYSKKTIVRRIVLEISYTFFVFRKIFKYQKNSDVILPIFPPSFYFYFIKPFIKKRIKKVAMVHDLQEVYSKNKSGHLYKQLGKAIHHIEKKCFNACDKLIFLSNQMCSVAKENYRLDENKIQIQYPFVTINKNQKLTKKLVDILPEDKKHVVYSGALGEKQNPQQLYNLFDYCSKQLQNVCFHIFSQGSLFEELKKTNSNSNIRFHNLVPKDSLEELYQRSAVQIIPQKEGTSEGSLPSKLPNLLASGCAILCITDKESEIDLLFKKHQLNTVVTSWNHEEIKESLDKILKENNKSKEKQIKISEQLFDINSMISAILEQ